MEEARLSPEEARLWHAWKRAGESVMSRVGRDLTEATGLSGSDFGVLSRLMDLGTGELRQNDLAESMSWDKSRLSHQLTRMEGRGFIQRRPAEGKGVLVGITAAGKKTLAEARPVHARSIQRLFARLGPGQRETLLEACELLQTLGDEGSE